MSLNIAANGKFGKYNKPNTLLHDPERVKKELEGERRKLRLLQVREESKNIARKIRNDVAAEKRRQMERLRSTKEKELDCWREQALAQEYQDYRSAIFQVGTAHRAAREENQLKAKSRDTRDSYKDFRRKYVCGRAKNESHTMNVKKKVKTVCTQTANQGTVNAKCKCAQTEMDLTANNKRKDKRKCDCFDSTPSESESESDMPCEQESSMSLSSSSSNVTCMKEGSSQTKSTQTVSKRTALCQTPAVVLDVEVDSNESVVISAPYEIKDRHTQYNRQFDCVVRSSPRDKSAERTQSEAQTAQTQESGISLPKINEKRFTQVSDLLNKQCSSGVKVALPKEKPPNVASAPHPTPTSTAPQRSPRKERSSVKPSNVASEVPTTTVGTTTCCGSGSSSSDRVQFYDYNSKLSKDYVQPLNLVHGRECSEAPSSAIEQAAIERRHQQEKQLGLLKQSKVTEERGQKALEREQVRRDCNQLTDQLDALTRQYPRQLPNNDNIYRSHYFTDKALRRERKLNAAVEELLAKPTVITCSEVAKSISCRTPALSVAECSNNLNVGTPPKSDDVSTDSCCSILLNYVEDQSKEVRKDLKRCADNSNQTKVERLKDLLRRLDELRHSLLRELQCGRETSREEDVRNVFDSISELRKERENILIDELVKEPINTEERNQDLQPKKTSTSGKLRNSNKNGKVATKSIERNVVHSALDKPLEIVIKVQGETKSVRVSGKTKRKVKKSPRKLASLIKSSPAKPAKASAVKRISPKNTISSQKEPLKWQNSYDSNSTSYRSLPPVIQTNVETISRCLASANTGQQQAPKKSKESEQSELARLNPLIAHYVQRLLGMSHKNILSLGVSSSDIETPSSTLINTTGNMTSLSEEVKVSDEHLASVQNFIEENRNFINELEETLRSYSNASLESSMRAFDEVWRKRFKQNQNAIETNRKRSNEMDDNKRDTAVRDVSQKREQRATQEPAAQAKGRPPSVRKCPPGDGSSQRSPSGDKTSIKNVDRIKGVTISGKPGLAADTRVDKKLAKRDKSIKIETQCKGSTDTDTDTQITRYAKLTENCMHRIAELTELINRVRREKQRLLEVTLSSVSENGGQSTEYLDLPDAKCRSRSEAETSADTSGERKQEEQPNSDSNKDLENQHFLGDRQMGASRDSGICVSRPATVQEFHTDMDPISITSSESCSAGQRRTKPPATLRRFSPQFVEDEIAHELSTIVEVDTPTTSRVITTAPPAKSALSHSPTPTGNSSSLQHEKPAVFPIFEQYVQDLKLDISQLDPEQSVRLQQEFCEMIVALQETRTRSDPKYVEFPSLHSYLAARLESEYNCTQNSNKETVADSFSSLRLTGIHPQHFPNPRDYMQSAGTNTNEAEQLLDTESLENVTKCSVGTETESVSVNIEEELKRRKILKNSFRSTKANDLFPSGTNSDENSVFHSAPMAAESGVEKISTTHNASDNMENYLEKSIRWSVEQEEEAPTCSGSTSTSLTLPSKITGIHRISCKRESRTVSSREDSANEQGQPLNLRDFLTKELLKHANFSASTSSNSDESLRSQFLQSIIDSMTPLCTPRSGVVSKSGAATLDRQKTSTPVPTHTHSTHTGSSSSSSTSTTQLFSGESHLSSVPY